MRANNLLKTWILLKSAWIMTDICSRAMLRSLTGSISREWVDITAHLWAKRLLKAARVNYNIHNPNNISFKSDRPIIIMANHTSHYDIPLTFAAVPGSLRMLAKKQLAKVPFMGGGMKAAGFLFVDRKNRAQAIKDLTIVKEKLNDGILVCFYPEGTRSRDGKLGKFKKGGFITAIETQALIIPLGIRGSDKIMPPDTFDLYLDQTIDIHIGQPIDAGEYTLEKRSELLAKTESVIRALTRQ